MIMGYNKNENLIIKLINAIRVGFTKYRFIKLNNGFCCDAGAVYILPVRFI